jgi:hypothetical protein
MGRSPGWTARLGKRYIKLMRADFLDILCAFLRLTTNDTYVYPEEKTDLHSMAPRPFCLEKRIYAHYKGEPSNLYPC